MSNALVCAQMFGFLQVLIDSESAQYYDNKGKTVMHQAAEQVNVYTRVVTLESLSIVTHTYYVYKSCAGMC